MKDRVGSVVMGDTHRVPGIPWIPARFTILQTGTREVGGGWECAVVYEL